MTAWGQLVAGKAQVASAQSQVTASEIALNGVREEAKAGQRTTLDVLNAQQALVNARVALVTAQHDRVVASYSVLSAVGRLSPQVLKLADHDLRSERALPAGARQLDRRSHARRPLIAAPSTATPETATIAAKADTAFAAIAFGARRMRAVANHSAQPLLLAIIYCPDVPFPVAAERFAPHPIWLWLSWVRRDASMPSSWGGVPRDESRGA